MGGERPRVIDFQHHYIPFAIAQRYGYARGTRVDHVVDGIKMFTLHDRLVDLEGQLADLDRAGVDVAVLSSPAGWDASREDCALINDELAAAQERYLGRFVGLAHLPLDSPAAIDELRRCVHDLGLHGAAIMTQVNGRPLDDPDLDPFYRLAEAEGLPVFVHPVSLVTGHRGSENYDLGRIIGREFDLVTAAVRVIAGGVLDRFPDLRFVFGHFGGGIAAILDRIRNKAFRFGTLRQGFDAYFARLAFDMAGFEGSPRALSCALTAMAPSQLLFATDYPQDFTAVTTGTGVGVEGIAAYAAHIASLPLPAEDRAAMLGGTAARLLRLQPAGAG